MSEIKPELFAMLHFQLGLEAAIKRNNLGYTFVNVYQKVDAGELGMFWNDTSCAIMQPGMAPIGPTLHVLFASGTQGGLFKLEEQVKEWAKPYGFKKLTTLGRKGFRRRLPKNGWKESYTFFEKDIS